MENEQADSGTQTGIGSTRPRYGALSTHTNNNRERKWVTEAKEGKEFGLRPCTVFRTSSRKTDKAASHNILIIPVSSSNSFTASKILFPALSRYIQIDKSSRRPTHFKVVNVEFLFRAPVMADPEASLSLLHDRLKGGWKGAAAKQQ